MDEYTHKQRRKRSDKQKNHFKRNGKYSSKMIRQTQEKVLNKKN
jgi:hypothetical protein